MLMQKILDAVDSPDLRSFENRLVAFANELDFGLAAAALVFEDPRSEPSVFSVGNIPAGFIEASRDPEDIKRDPVIKRFKKLNVPFTYDQSTYRKEGAIDLWEKQAPFGYKNGIALALHLPYRRHLLLGIDREARLPTNEDRISEQLGILQLFATHTQTTAVRLLTPATGRLSLPKLTRREAHVLRLTADGKSSWAVAEILGLSECTINFHIRNIHKKLDTSTKQQAVSKAALLGLIVL